jgi:hypothetical protein
MARIIWNEKVLPAVKERLAHFNNRGINPTLRAMFYALFSLKVFPNTETYYKSLSHYTTIWRENGILPLAQEYIDGLTGSLGNAALDYEDIIPLWHNQPEYVEVFIEKKAHIGLFRSILRGSAAEHDRHVRIVPGGGFSGPGFNAPNVARLLKLQREGKNIHIVYFGDLDPSGENIEEVVTDKLEQYGLEDVDFERIALTDEQVLW